jgi:hypothetical protein
MFTDGEEMWELESRVRRTLGIMQLEGAQLQIK